MGILTAKQVAERDIRAYLKKEGKSYIHTSLRQLRIYAGLEFEREI